MLSTHPPNNTGAVFRCSDVCAQDARDLLKQVLSMIPDQVVAVDMTGAGSGGSDEDAAKEGSALKEAISGGRGEHAVVLVTSSG